VRRFSFVLLSLIAITQLGAFVPSRALAADGGFTTVVLGNEPEDEFTTVVLGDEPEDEFTTVVLGDDPVEPAKPEPVKPTKESTLAVMGEDEFLSSTSEPYFLEELPPAPPIPSSITLAYTLGKLNRAQVGASYWFTKAIGMGLEVGLDGSRHTKTVAVADESRTVTTAENIISPALDLLYSFQQIGPANLFAAAGGGPYIVQSGRSGWTVGAMAFAGPGIDWRVTKQISVHAGERILFLRMPDPKIGNTYGLETLWAANWWFE
jgi:hypothetical protein